jgi:hypothetical protein
MQGTYCGVGEETNQHRILEETPKTEEDLRRLKYKEQMALKYVLKNGMGKLSLY